MQAPLAESPPSDAKFERDIVELRERFRSVLDQRVAPGSRVAFIDFPYDTNVGNHMMWLAGMTYFEQRGVDVVYSAHINAFRPESLRRAIGDGLIVFNGGVGMSTLWPRPTGIKRSIAREFRNNPLLVLPSTVGFKSREDQDSVRDLFDGHDDVFLMARDAVTHEVMQETFAGAKAVLVPDSTFMLPRQERVTLADYPITWLVRNDHESIGYEPPEGVHIFDWAGRSLATPRDFPFAHYRMRLAGLATRVRNNDAVGGATDALTNSAVTRLYHQVSRRILRSGNDDLDRGRVVVTDRFHTHILAILRNQPVVMLVDAYGKNEASYRSWTHRFPNVHLALNPAQALELANELANALDASS